MAATNVTLKNKQLNKTENKYWLFTSLLCRDLLDLYLSYLQDRRPSMIRMLKQMSTKRPFTSKKPIRVIRVNHVIGKYNESLVNLGNITSVWWNVYLQ